jgi:hypothetical protein
VRGDVGMCWMLAESTDTTSFDVFGLIPFCREDDFFMDVYQG